MDNSPSLNREVLFEKFPKRITVSDYSLESDADANISWWYQLRIGESFHVTELSDTKRVAWTGRNTLDFYKVSGGAEEGSIILKKHCKKPV